MKKERDIVVIDIFDGEESSPVLEDELASSENEAKKEEKSKSLSSKKPPRPPRGLSIDAADQKLIKELSELAMIKRARMKAIKKMKTAKVSASASPQYSSSSFISVLVTLLLCLVIIFGAGCHPSRKSTAALDGETIVTFRSHNLSTTSFGVGSSDLVMKQTAPPGPKLERP